MAYYVFRRCSNYTSLSLIYVLIASLIKSKMALANHNKKDKKIVRMRHATVLTAGLAYYRSTLC